MPLSSKVPLGLPQTIVRLSGTEMFGRESKLADILHELEAVPRHHATVVLAQLASMEDPESLESSVEMDREFFREYLLDDQLRRRADHLDRTRDPDTFARTAFDRQLFVRLLLIAQRACSDSESISVSTEMRHALGRALIHLGDVFIHPQDQARTDMSEEALFTLIFSTLDLCRTPTSRFAHVRVLRMLRSRRWQTDFLLEEGLGRFLDRYLIPPLMYFYFTCTLGSKLQTINWIKNNIFDMRAVLTKARSKHAFRKILDEISIPLAELPSRVGTAEEIIRDHPLTLLRSHPLIALASDKFICADRASLVLRSTGISWTLTDLFVGKEREDFRSAWGTLFEDAVHEMLPDKIKKRARKAPGPKDSELTDLLVDYGKHVVVIECKAATVADTVKSARDFQQLEKSLREKFMKKDQLARCICRLFGKAADPKMKAILKDHRVEYVYPVIVSEDLSPSSPGVSGLLASMLKKALHESKFSDHPIIRPLILLSADDLAGLTPLLSEGHSLWRLLDVVHEHDPEGQSTFRDVFFHHGPKPNESSDIAWSKELGDFVFDPMKSFIAEEGIADLSW